MNDQLMQPAIDFAILNASKQAIDDERVKYIKNLMLKLKLSATQAMDLLDIPSDQHDKYLALI